DGFLAGIEEFLERLALAVEHLAEECVVPRIAGFKHERDLSAELGEELARIGRHTAAAPLNDAKAFQGEHHVSPPFGWRTVRCQFAPNSRHTGACGKAFGAVMSGLYRAVD